MRPTPPASQSPVYKDVVLIGGGHTHVEVLRRFGASPRPGVRLTLITNTLSAPYSGMIPGFVSGHYTLQECHIDLCRLATFANARVILSSAIGVDSKAQRVELEHFAENFEDRPRPSIPYDVLSINVGITPATAEIPGVNEFTTPVKPISALAVKIDGILDGFVRRCRADGGNDGEPYRVAVVGGGAGGVELACALQYRLARLVEATEGRQTGGKGATVDDDGVQYRVALISKGPILATSPVSVRDSMRALLAERGVRVIESDVGVTRVERGTLFLHGDGDTAGSTEAFDDCLWCTRASAPSWFTRTDLELDDAGYILVDEFLAARGPGTAPTSSTRNVFGAGDCVAMFKSPRPKAGVYAVRAGPVISDNIFRALEGQPPKSWTPQSTNLSIISCGDRYALMSKSWLNLHGGWVWSWKDHIDRKFMTMYGDGLRMSGSMSPAASSSASASTSASSTAPELDLLLTQAAMRCGGCGSKVGASLLSSVLSKLGVVGDDPDDPDRPDDPDKPATSLDDAAFLPAVPANAKAIQTIDYFKCPPLLQDPFVFGYIAAVHAMSDCYAMNGVPTSALALAVVPFASSRKTEEELYQLMAGASAALADAGCKLIGGHTSEGAELAMGFRVTGNVPKHTVWHKGGMRAGDEIILVKALGTGVIMAAAQAGLPVGKYIPEIIASMCQSNRHAHAVLQKYADTVSACTDVTGFGLLGHLAEMCRASRMTCRISASDVPVFPGALECVELGATSSLSAENDRSVSRAVDRRGRSGRDGRDGHVPVSDALYQVMIDPQTSGGLLLTLPTSHSDRALADLRGAGLRAAKIGVCLPKVQAKERETDDERARDHTCISFE